MPNCTSVNGAGHQCCWPDGHKKHGFVGIGGPTNPAVPVHGYWNALGFWEIWPATPAPAQATKGAS
jgi:hypothetical protein